MTSPKQRASEVYQQHIALASTDGRLFRKTVIEQLMAELDCSLASAATHYNNAKKAAPVEGLGRPTVTSAIRKPGVKGKATEELQPDNECFTVLELVKEGSNEVVGRCRSHLMQGDASEDFDLRVQTWPNAKWVMIKGLGPISGESFKLDADESEVKRYPEESVDTVVA